MTDFHSVSLWVGRGNWFECWHYLTLFECWHYLARPHKISIGPQSSSLYIPDHPLRCVIPAASGWRRRGGRGIILDRMRQDFLPTNVTICSIANNRPFQKLNFCSWGPKLFGQNILTIHSCFTACNFYMVVFNVDSDSIIEYKCERLSFWQTQHFAFPPVELSFWCFDKSHWICATFSTGFVFLWHAGFAI